MTYLYCLEKNGIVFYIGKTTNPDEREKQHLFKFKTPLKLIILDECSDKDSFFWESHYIWLYKSWGFNLKNKQLLKTNPINKRIEIKITDVPTELHEIIAKNAKLARRTLGNELLINYKP